VPDVPSIRISTFAVAQSLTSMYRTHQNLAQAIDLQPETGLRLHKNARLIFMDSYRRSGQSISSNLRYLALSAAFTIIGCASPGPPHAPSLRLPQPVRDLSATRVGNTVELHFTAPSTSTDKLPLHGATVAGQFCRQLPHQPCIAVPSSRTSVAMANANDTRNQVTWIDTLPPSLTQGSPQLLAYRVEFFSAANRSAGLSAPAFTATGPAPSSVENLYANGSRLGIILQWDPSPTPGEVVLRRDDLAPPKPKHPEHPSPSPHAEHNSSPGTMWLQTGDSNSANPQQARTLDTAALPDTPYRYSAQRRTTLQLASHSIELRSDLSTPLDFTLLKLYSPPTPTGLTAAGFFSGTPQTFAVDLVWQPIDEAGLITPLAGYNLYREPLDAAASSTAPRTQLNTTPIPQPSFHDTTANPATLYRYSVTAVDTKGNESPSTTVLLQPSNQP
jgi:hypothetical protein